MFKKPQLDHQRKKNMSSKKQNEFPRIENTIREFEKTFKKRNLKGRFSSLDLSWKLQYIITFISLKFSSCYFTLSFLFLKVGTNQVQTSSLLRRSFVSPVRPSSRRCDCLDSTSKQRRCVWVCCAKIQVTS